MRSVPFPAGTLVVSCQAQPQSPLHGTSTMTRMALAAVLGGAEAIRANGPDDVRAIASAVDRPVIGIWKCGDPDGVYITPTFREAEAVATAGAAVVALDATDRPRPDGSTVADLVRRIDRDLGVPVMADVDGLAAGLAAADAGAALVATTLSGYTPSSATGSTEPDLVLVERLAARSPVPIVAEGRYRTGADLRRAFDAGAYAVVVGGAITDPAAITARLLSDANGGRP